MELSLVDGYIRVTTQTAMLTASDIAIAPDTQVQTVHPRAKARVTVIVAAPDLSMVVEAAVTTSVPSMRIFQLKPDVLKSQVLDLEVVVTKLSVTPSQAMPYQIASML